jgi:hypothetical protein
LNNTLSQNPDSEMERTAREFRVEINKEKDIDMAAIANFKNDIVAVIKSSNLKTVKDDHTLKEDIYYIPFVLSSLLYIRWQ